MIVGIDGRVLATPVKTGVAQYTQQLLGALFAIDRTNQYVVFVNALRDASVHLPVWPYDNVRIVHTHFPNKLLHTSMHLFGAPTIEQLIGERFDAFFCPNPHFLALDPSTRLIVTVHDLSFDIFPDWYTWKQRVWHRAVGVRQLCARAEGIVTPSAHTKRDVVNRYRIPSERVHAIFPGLSQVSEGDISPEFLAKVPKRYVLFVGTIEPRKNVAGLLAAYRQYRARHKYPVDLVVAGPYGWKSRRDMYHLLHTPGVVYLGYVSEREKQSLYEHACAFVYPSLYEGFGLPVLEALAHGIPVVTSNRTSLADVGGGAAILVDPYSARHIADAIEKGVHDEQARVCMAVGVKKRQETFSWAQSAIQLRSLFEKV